MEHYPAVGALAFGTKPGWDKEQCAERPRTYLMDILECLVGVVLEEKDE